MARTFNDALRKGRNDGDIPKGNQHNPALPSPGRKSVPDRHTNVKKNTGMSRTGYENPMGDLQRAAKKRLFNAPGLRKS